MKSILCVESLKSHTCLFFHLPLIQYFWLSIFERPFDGWLDGLLGWLRVGGNQRGLKCLIWRSVSVFTVRLFPKDALESEYFGVYFVLPASWCFFKVLLPGPATTRDHLRRFNINTYRNTQSVHTNETKYSRASRFNVKLPIDGRLPWVILKRNCALARLS